MIRILCALMALFMLPGCMAEGISDSAMESAAAVVSMHDAVMRDVMGLDFSFANLAGAGDIYVLFSDEAGENFLMVGLDETGERAANAVIQVYDETAFAEISLNSLRAMYLPFCQDGAEADFESWLSGAAYEAVTAVKNSEDMEIDYFYGDYAACGIGAYHDGEKVLFTAVIEWAAPISAGDINALMN